MSNIKFNFEGKNIVITGGAQGIGLQIAKDFLTSGAQVELWDFSEQALQAAGSELTQFKSKITLTKVDVSSAQSCAAAAQSLPWAVDVLVNNAGITRDKSFVKMTHEEWDAVIATNLSGLFNVSKSLQEKFNTASMQKRIINISSVVGIYGNFGQANYAAAKAGVIGFTKTLGKELGRKGFTVNAIAPGFIQTAMTKMMPPEALEMMKSKVPVARLGQPADIANACLFLSSEQASYLNATVVSVDGGIIL